MSTVPSARISCRLPAERRPANRTSSAAAQYATPTATSTLASVVLLPCGSSSETPTSDAPAANRNAKPRDIVARSAIAAESSGALGPVTLLVLLAGPAPARVVAADLLVLVHPALFDDRQRLLLVALGLGIADARGRRGSERAGGARATGVLDLARAAGAGCGVVLRRAVAVGALDLHLDVEDHAREVRPDGVHQVAEQLERLVLVGDERVDLGEPAQVDALAQVVHVVQVLAPALVDDLQQQVALQRAHQLVAELGFAPVVEGDRLAGERVGELDAVGMTGQLLLVGGDVGGEDVLQPGREAADVPVLDEVRARVVVDHA